VRAELLEVHVLVARGQDVLVAAATASHRLAELLLLLPALRVPTQTR
jgi:hypothetical protein